MTTKKTKGAKPVTKKARRLSLNKQTLRDLGVRDSNPKGGRARMSTLICVENLKACQASTSC